MSRRNLETLSDSMMDFFFADAKSSFAHKELSEQDKQKNRDELIAIQEELADLIARFNKSAGWEEQEELRELIKIAESRRLLILNVFIQSCFYLALKAAKKYCKVHWSLDFPEVLQVANYALVEAADTYDPRISAFSTYATWILKKYFLQFFRSQYRFDHAVPFPEDRDLKSYYLKVSGLKSDLEEQVIRDEEQNVGLPVDAGNLLKEIIEKFCQFYSQRWRVDIDTCRSLITYVAVTLPNQERPRPSTVALSERFSLPSKRITEILRGYAEFIREVPKDTTIARKYYRLFHE